MTVHSLHVSSLFEGRIDCHKINYTVPDNLKGS